jgi:hypothetical protein
MCIMVRLCSLRMLPHQRQQTPVYLTYAESKAFYSMTGSAAARPQKAGMAWAHAAWQTITASLSLSSPKDPTPCPQLSLSLSLSLSLYLFITATQTRPSQDAKGHKPLSSFYTHTPRAHIHSHASPRLSRN